MAFQQFRAAAKKKGGSKPATDSSLSAIFDTIAKATSRASRVNRDGTILALHQALPAEVREALVAHSSAIVTTLDAISEQKQEDAATLDDKEVTAALRAAPSIPDQLQKM